MNIIHLMAVREEALTQMIQLFEDCGPKHVPSPSSIVYADFCDKVHRACTTHLMSLPIESHYETQDRDLRSAKAKLQGMLSDTMPDDKDLLEVIALVQKHISKGGA